MLCTGHVRYASTPPRIVQTGNFYDTTHGDCISKYASHEVHVMYAICELAGTSDDSMTYFVNCGIPVCGLCLAQ